MAIFSNIRKAVTRTSENVTHPLLVTKLVALLVRAVTWENGETKLVTNYSHWFINPKKRKKEYIGKNRLLRYTPISERGC